MRTATRHRLTEAAVKRFYRDGFGNVGLEQLLSDVGISKTAFYKHFDCKEDFVLAALKMKNLWLQGEFRAIVRELGQMRLWDNGLCSTWSIGSLMPTIIKVAF